MAVANMLSNPEATRMIHAIASGLADEAGKGAIIIPGITQKITNMVKNNPTSLQTKYMRDLS